MVATVTEIFLPGARLETIVFGWVPPDGVASNSVRTTERELVTTTTTDRVTFFRGFATGAAAGGALATGAAGALAASVQRPPWSLTPRRQPTRPRRKIEVCSCRFLLSPSGADGVPVKSRLRQSYLVTYIGLLDPFGRQAHRTRATVCAPQKPACPLLSRLLQAETRLRDHDQFTSGPLGGQISLPACTNLWPRPNGPGGALLCFFNPRLIPVRPALSCTR